MIFDASGVALNYRLEGKGQRPLICVHGVGSYLEAWDGVVRGLDPDFRILRFDLRGHGRSMRVKGRYEIADFVRDLGLKKVAILHLNSDWGRTAKDLLVAAIKEGRAQP